MDNKEEPNKWEHFETPEASPRKEGDQTGSSVDPFAGTPPFAQRSTYSTPKSTPGTPGRLEVVTKGTP